jgi:hypothetical protein
MLKNEALFGALGVKSDTAYILAGNLISDNTGRRYGDETMAYINDNERIAMLLAYSDIALREYNQQEYAYVASYEAFYKLFKAERFEDASILAKEIMSSAKIPKSLVRGLILASCQYYEETGSHRAVYTVKNAAGEKEMELYKIIKAEHWKRRFNRISNEFSIALLAGFCGSIVLLMLGYSEIIQLNNFLVFGLMLYIVAYLFANNTK